MMDRRKFIEKSLLLGAAGMVAPPMVGTNEARATPRMTKDDISIAQWALVDEVRSGLWKTLDFPKIYSAMFDINGIEFVNTLYEVPTMSYRNQLKKNTDDHGVTMLLIMVYTVGEGAYSTKKYRQQFTIN